MPDIDVRRGKETDIPRIQKCLYIHGGKNHIYVRNPDLFKWQNLDIFTRYVNFLLPEVEGKIESLLGYITNSHFGPLSPSNRAILLVWNSIERPTIPGAGLMLLRKCSGNNRRPLYKHYWSYRHRPFCKPKTRFHDWGLRSLCCVQSTNSAEAEMFMFCRLHRMPRRDLH